MTTSRRLGEFRTYWDGSAGPRSNASISRLPIWRSPRLATWASFGPVARSGSGRRCSISEPESRGPLRRSNEPSKLGRRISSSKNTTKELTMISVFVTFTYKDDFNESKLRQIAESAKPRFEGMPGLRSKVFTLRPEHAQATNVYVWDSEEQARAFFTEQMLERVTGLYGVRPTIEYAVV